MEDSTDKYNALRHSAHGESPHFLWYNTRPHISNFRVWGCAIEAKLPPTTKSLDHRTESGYYLGITSTKAVICYWNPKKPYEIGYCTTAKFYEHQTFLPNGELSTGSKLSQGIPHKDDHQSHAEVLTLDYQDHPLLSHPPKTIRFRLPPQGKSIGLSIKMCTYHNLPYISTSDPSSNYYNKVNKI